MAPRQPKAPREKPPVDPARLVRAGAGRYATGDGRFGVEQSSGGWMLTDEEQANEFGLPLVRGPFATLDAAREALAGLRSGPAPISDLSERITAIAKRVGAPEKRSGPEHGNDPPATATAAEDPPTPPEPLPVVVREFRSRDGDGLRTLWRLAGFNPLGDDDMSLRRFAQRNPGLFLVAAQGPAVVGSAMGGWDGWRGWIYHVATAPVQRRQGVATKLVRQVEAGLHAVGCRRAIAIVRDANDVGAAFWVALGYEVLEAHQFGRKLRDDAELP